MAIKFCLNCRIWASDRVMWCDLSVCGIFFASKCTFDTNSQTHFNLIISAVDQRVNVKMQAQAKFKSQCKIDASLSVFSNIQMQKWCAICDLNVFASARAKNRTLKRARYFTSNKQTNRRITREKKHIKLHSYSANWKQMNLIRTHTAHV